MLDYLRRDRRRWASAAGRAGLQRVLGPFVALYAESDAFQAMREEATHVDEEMAGLRHDLSRLFAIGIERALVEGVEWPPAGRGQEARR